MTNEELFWQAVIKPITEATVLGAILAGIIMATVYWRNVKVSFYNGLIFNLAFFAVIFVARRFADGISTAGGYIGLFLLYTLFLGTAYMTKMLLDRLK